MTTYCDDPRINEVVESMVGFFDVNPWNRGEPHSDKTIPCMMEAVRALFGDYAATVRITEH